MVNRWFPYADRQAPFFWNRVFADVERGSKAVAGGGGGAGYTSDKWRYRWVKSEQTSNLQGDIAASFDELLFLATAASSTMPGSGSWTSQYPPISGTLAMLSDGDVSNFMYFTSASDCWAQITFNNSQTIAAVKVATRVDGYAYQTPTWAHVEYYNGSTWVEAANVRFFGGPGANAGGGVNPTAVFSDMADEPSGYRYWWIEFTNNYAAGGAMTLSEIALSKSGTAYGKGKIYGLDSPGGLTYGNILMAINSVYAPGPTEFFGWAGPTGTMAFDFGYKRKPDALDFWGRDSWGTQMPRTLVVKASNVNSEGGATVVTTYSDPSGSAPGTLHTTVSIP